ncbi:MAG: putative LPS assembly protein LptD, partial [bacterium]
MRSLTVCCLLILVIFAADGFALPQSAARIRLESAGQSRFGFADGGIVSHFWDGVRFTRGEAKLTADSAVYYENEDRVELYGQVSVVEEMRSLDADTLFYDHRSGLADAFGNVVIRDYGRHVRLDGGRAQVFEDDETLVLWRQPRLIMDFDLQRLQTFVLADTIKYFSSEQTVSAINSVKITQGTLEATSDQATFYTDKEQFRLTGNVKARQRLNTLAGEEMMVFSQDKVLQRIELEGKGEAIFRQSAQADTIAYNESRLLATAIDFYFAEDQLELIRAAGNSYIYYNPAPEDTVAKGRNVASGDSTILYFSNTQLDSAFVITSAEGTYLSELEYDSLGNIAKADTIEYQADRIAFMFDSDIIYLNQTAQVKQGSVQLDADRIRYDIAKKTLHAHGSYDSTGVKFVPLILRDGGEQIEGEELAFDLGSKRGKIRHSRTMQDKHVYQGETLRKEEENVFLVDGSIYIPCDLENPGFHFDLGRTKVQTGEKVWARPVVLYIETIPVLAVPYFVFSTKKGRHSGFTTFQLGNFEQGQRFVNNLGYYWALSEYFDLKTTLDVSESAGLKFNAGLRYALRYKLSGYIDGSYSRETDFLDYERVHPIRW